MEVTLDWLLKFFSEKADLKKYDSAQVLDVNYFDEGFIDSFGIIDLVMKIESHYLIKIPNDAFQDRRFSTIKGLAEIIEEQKGK